LALKQISSLEKYINWKVVFLKQKNIKQIWLHKQQKLKKANQTQEKKDKIKLDKRKF
jgi:hypothetical protein